MSKQWTIGEVTTNFDSTSFKILNYFKEPFNDQETVEAWSSMYGDIFNTGWMVDYRRYQPSWAQDIADELGLENSGTSFYRMDPGTILPYHSDTYARYCDYHSVDSNDVYRAVVFLEEWKPGHVFEIDGVPVVKYAKGTYVLWRGDVPHLAANIGPNHRYTLQITGLLPDGIE